MAVTGLDFLSFAQQAQSQCTEIAYRNIVSRAYYACYHSVLGVLEDPVPKYTNGGVHSNLIEYLSGGSLPEIYDKRELRKLSYILKQQKELRCEADYDISSSHITKLTAEDSLNQAEKVTAICNSLSNAA